MATTTATENIDAAAFLQACRLNPSVFGEFILDIEQADVHEQFQNFLTDHDDCYAELHRGIGKTTQLAPIRIAWEIGHDQGLRIKYVQQTDVEAEKTCGLIRDIIESDNYCKVFPWVKPDYECWGKGAFKVKRKRWTRDPTVEAKGIGGRAGGRVDILAADDICDLRNAIQRPAEREKVKESWVNNWLPMRDLSAKRPPRTWKVGTCYHVADITADWRKYHEARGELLRLPVSNFTSPWSSVYTRERLEAIRVEVGPIAFARAYELQPVSSEMIIFSAEWLDRSLYHKLHASQTVGHEVIATFDFAFTEKRMDGDPDWSVCLIGLKTANGHVFVREMVRMRGSYPEFKRKAIEACIRHGVKRAGAEANGPQAGLQQQLDAEAPFPVMPITREKDKVTRAAECQSFVESGRFHILADADQFGVMRPVASMQPLYDEMTTFPAGEHDDTVDTAVDMMDMATTIGRAPLPMNPITTQAVGNRFKRLYG